MDAPNTSTEPLDLFVSYAGPDRPWAEWAAQQLETAGYSVELDVWDWAAGSNAVLKMNDALARARRVLIMYSTAYFDRSRFTVDEWTGVVAERPNGGEGRLVPVRVQEVKPPPILTPLVYRDLFGLNEQRARAELLAAVGGPRRPKWPVPFPGATFSAGAGAGARPPGTLPSMGSAPTESPPTGGVRMPGSLPAVWNVRRRNPVFTGRHRELARLREQLCSGQRASVQVLHGIGGVGKTELAVEYAHLFANEYEVVWWIDAERPELIAEQLAALSSAAGWTHLTSAPASTTADGVLRRLQQDAGWLLIYDNAESVDIVAAMIPDGPGHVLITSRSRRTGGVALSLAVEVLDRSTSRQLLRSEAPALSPGDAERLADATGDLPLALGQAAGLFAETGMTVDEYLRELSASPAMVLAEGPTGQYPQSLAAVVTTSMRHLAARDEAAAQLMHMVAVLAPERIQLRWLTDAPEATLPQALATTAASAFSLRRTLGRISAFGLARVDAETFQVHRLTQAIISSTASTFEIEHADQLIAAAAPDDERNPTQWPRWAELLPHLLLRAPYTRSAALRQTASRSLYYLNLRGEYRIVQSLANLWYHQWIQDVGADDRAILTTVSQLANACRQLGEYKQARMLHEYTLARRRRVLGDNHPETLTSASNLAAVLTLLGEYDQARQLEEDTLTRRRLILGDDHPETLRSADVLAAVLALLGEDNQARRMAEDTLTHRRLILGDDHPDTLRTASNLAVVLASLGERDKARQMAEDTHTRRRRVLGDDHPDTLRSAHNLAYDLRRLGEYDQARQLDEDTLTRRRRVLGDDHPDTLKSAHNLAYDLRQLGEYDQARQLDEDTLTRQRRVLGDDHPDIHGPAHNLAHLLNQLGEYDQAQQPDEDVGRG